MLTVYETEIRTRYQETDAQTRIHHANYITYFEIARTEMLRADGYSYRRMEEEGLFLVVSEVECKYYQGANFDDLLRVVATVTKAKGARIEHHYQVFREDTLLAEGRTLLGCVDPSGKPKRIPEHLRLDPRDT